MAYLLSYAASYVVVLVIVTVLQKRGYPFFPSALSAISLTMFWPVFAVILLALLAGPLIGKQWQKVENWWSTSSAQSAGGLE